MHKLIILKVLAKIFGYPVRTLLSNMHHVRISPKWRTNDAQSSCQKVEPDRRDLA
jgi:hypothetical protein